MHSQLGLGDTNDQTRPVLAESLRSKSVQHIACGSGHTVVLTGRSTTPLLDLRPARRLSVPTSERHAPVWCALLAADGEVFTWGRGDDGRLGHGDNGWKYVPRRVDALRGKCIKQITCGSYHTAAITDSGELYTWGGGMYGKLGHGSETGQATPRRVEALAGRRVDLVACGSRHTVIVVDEGDVYSWGDKENGVAGETCALLGPA